MRQGKGTLNELSASANQQEPRRQVQRLLQVALSVEAPRPQASASPQRAMKMKYTKPADVREN